MDLGVEFMVSVNGGRYRVVTANARGKYKLVWHTYLEGSPCTACPIFCYENGIDVANPDRSTPRRMCLRSAFVIKPCVSHLSIL